MPSRVSGEPEEQFYGAQEASRYLGLHRSTLHVAIRQNLIVPDQFTPGGHARFRRETLESFRLRLADIPATSRGGALVPVRALAQVARMLVEARQLEEVCQTAVDAIRRVLPAVDRCQIIVRTGNAQGGLDLRVMAEHNLPATYFSDYLRLRGTFRFVTTTAMCTREDQFCEQVSVACGHSGTLYLMERLRATAYGVIPILTADDALGVVVCLTREPHRFTEEECTFLHGIADELAVALIAAAQQRQLAASMTISRMLMQRATQARAALASSPDAEAHMLAVRELGALFTSLSGASELCTLGFEADLASEITHLTDLASAARAGDEAVTATWRMGGKRFAAVGASVPVRTQHRGGVAAAWTGERPFPEADHALLLTFAGALVVCAGVV